MDDINKISIPEKHQKFCMAVGRLCREHGIRKCGLTYSPDFRDEWGGDIAMSWEQGRHGEDSDRIHINSTVRVWTRLGPEKDRI